jgi:predicted porin
MPAPRLILPAALVAVACATQAGATESSLYASLRQAIVFTDSGAPGGDSDDVGILDQGSRVGFQGNQSFGEFNGFGLLEIGVDAAEQSASPGVRLGYVGVSGEFGIVSFGSQWSAWDTYVGGGHTNFVNEGSWHNGTGRNGSTLKYAGRLGQLSVEADVVLEGKSEPDAVTGIAVNSGLMDEIQLALGYTVGGFTANAALIERDGGANGYQEGGGSLYGARLSYEAGPMAVSVAVAQEDSEFGQNAEETTGLKVRAAYKSGANSFLAVVTTADNEAAANQPLGVAVGYQHDLSQRSRVALEMSSVDPDIAGLDSSIEGGVMFRHDW